ncbi:MAG: glycosyltransferase family 9 protein [Thermodesulfobacteriota bacterium]
MVIKGKKIETNGIRNILLIQLGDIGDVVLTLPSVRALREHFPRAAIIIAVRKKAQQLVEDCPWVSGVISVDTDKRSLTQEIAHQINFFSGLRKYHFDLALDMRRGTRGGVLAFLSGARQRVGFYSYKKGLWRNRLFSHLVSPDKPPDQYMAEYYLGLLKRYDLNTAKSMPELPIPREKQEKAAAFLKEEGIPLDRPLIAMHPFSLWHYKEWRLEKVAQLAGWIWTEYHFPVLIIGSPKERERAHIIERTGGRHIFNLAGKTSLDMLGPIIKLCTLLIGIDSAGIHLAAAVGTSTVSIFGPSLFPAWAPRGSDHVVVHKQFPCVPCDKKGCNGSEFSLCLEELTVEEVTHGVKAQIGKAFEV